MTRDLSRRGFLGAASAAVATGTAMHTASAKDSDKAPAGKPIKIVGVCCSPRKEKTTATSLAVCLDAAREVDRDNIQTELIELAGMKIDGSLAAGLPLEPGQRDDFPALVPRLSDPQVAGIIIGTPVYFANMTSLCKAFLERCMTFRKNDFALRDKVAGVLAVGGARNGGQELTIQSVQAALFCQQMVLVGEAPPSSHFGAAVWNDKNKSDVTQDACGMASAKALGRRVAELAVRMAHG